MTLDIERPDGSRYEVKDKWLIAADEPVSVGSELRVLIDPGREDRLAIDWPQTRAVYRSKTEERRKILAAGVAVPVSKLKEVTASRQAPAIPLTQTTPAEEAQGVPPQPTPVAVTEPPPRREEGPMTRHEAELLGAVSVRRFEEPPPAEFGSPGTELLERLERLSALHARGELTDDEFAAVKRHLIA